MNEKIRIQTDFDLLMDDGKVTLELYLLASNIKKKVIVILDFFLHCYKAMKKKKLITCFPWC